MLKGQPKVDNGQLDTLDYKTATQLITEYGITPPQPTKNKKCLLLLAEGKEEKVRGFGCFSWEFDDDYYFAAYGKLYILRYDKNWRKRFFPDTEKDEKFVVPLSELELVPDPRTVSVPIGTQEAIGVKDDYDYEANDLPFKGMTLRQYACIHSGVPKTGIPWLDEIISLNSVIR